MQRSSSFSYPTTLHPAFEQIHRYSTRVCYSTSSHSLPFDYYCFSPDASQVSPIQAAAAAAGILNQHDEYTRQARLQSVAHSCQKHHIAQQALAHLQDGPTPGPDFHRPENKQKTNKTEDKIKQGHEHFGTTRCPRTVLYSSSHDNLFQGYVG